MCLSLTPTTMLTSASCLMQSPTSLAARLPSRRTSRSQRQGSHAEDRASRLPRRLARRSSSRDRTDKTSPGSRPHRSRMCSSRPSVSRLEFRYAMHTHPLCANSDAKWSHRPTAESTSMAMAPLGSDSDSTMRRQPTLAPIFDSCNPPATLGRAQSRVGTDSGSAEALLYFSAVRPAS